MTPVRRWILLSLFIVTPLGFGFKFYEGPGRWWFCYYGAGVMYEIFWCLVFFFLFPRKKNITTIVVTVLAVTCALEVMQLWQADWLLAIRSTYPGWALLGTTFVWWDFPHYVLGCAVGWGWLRLLWGKQL